MNESQVRAILTAFEIDWKVFSKWIVGHTLTSGANGETLYFIMDVKRFILGVVSTTTYEKWDKCLANLGINK